MTYILGSRCKDWVVLIADTKFTVDGGTRYDYDDKLIRVFKELLSMVIGFSGSREPFTHLRMRLSERRKELEKEFYETEKISTDKINNIIIEVMKSLRGYHSGNEYDMLVGISAKPSVLTYFYQDGRPEEVRGCKAIGDWTYGSVFLNENWDEDMDMKTVAGIGYFVIRYIEKFQLNLGIGTGGDKPYPNVKFLPDYSYDYDASPEQIRKFEEDAKRNLDRLNNAFKLDFCS